MSDVKVVSLRDKATTVQVGVQGPAGATDHGALSGLADDDHSQYHNDARGDARYAPIAKGVTNGDSHNHVGGDGAQIAYTDLSGLPTLGTAAATNATAYESAGSTATHAALTTTHGISTYGATLVDDADAATARSTLGIGNAATRNVGTTSGTVAAGDDARLSDARTPVGHTHATGDVTGFSAAALAAAPAETASTVGTLISGATSKSTPVASDLIGLSDSESAGILRKLSWSDLESALRLGVVWNVSKLPNLETQGHFNIQRQTSGPNIYLDCISDHVSNGHSVYNMRRANGTPAALTGVVAGDEYGAIACRVHNGTGWEDHSGSLSWGASEDHTLTANGSSFALYTVRNGTVGSWQALGVDGAGKTSIYGGLLVSGNLATSVDIFSTVPSTQVTSYNGINVQLSTAAASFTLADMFLHRIRNTTLGSGSSITRLTGFRIEDLTAGTSNFGFRSLVSAGASKWNLFIDGTAQNYIIGSVGIGLNVPVAKLHVLSTTEQLRLSYDAANYASFTVSSAGVLTITTTGTAPALLLSGDIRFDKTVTASGTTGAQTINKPIGSVNFAAGATSMVVTDNKVSTSSVIVATVGTNDTTMKSVAVVASSGSFTLYANAAATAETRVNFHVFN